MELSPNLEASLIDLIKVCIPTIAAIGAYIASKKNNRLQKENALKAETAVESSKQAVIAQTKSLSANIEENKQMTSNLVETANQVHTLVNGAASEVKQKLEEAQKRISELEEQLKKKGE